MFSALFGGLLGDRPRRRRDPPATEARQTATRPRHQIYLWQEKKRKRDSPTTPHTRHLAEARPVWALGREAQVDAAGLAKARLVRRRLRAEPPPLRRRGQVAHEADDVAWQPLGQFIGERFGAPPATYGDRTACELRPLLRRRRLLLRVLLLVLLQREVDTRNGVADPL